MLQHKNVLLEALNGIPHDALRINGVRSSIIRVLYNHRITELKKQSPSIEQRQIQVRVQELANAATLNMSRGAAFFICTGNQKPGNFGESIAQARVVVDFTFDADEQEKVQGLITWFQDHPDGFAYTPDEAIPRVQQTVLTIGSAEKQVHIKVVQHPKLPVFFKMDPDTELQELMDAYAAHQGEKVAQLRFIFDADRIRGYSTPAMLDMEDGDMLEVFKEVFGGQGCTLHTQVTHAKGRGSQNVE